MTWLVSVYNRAQRQTTSVLQDNSTTCSISWWQKFWETVTLRGQRCGKCKPFGSHATAEFENNDRCCDTVKRLQRKETWTKRTWEKSPAGIGAHIVRHLIWMFGGKKHERWGQRRGEQGGNRPRDKETDDKPKKNLCLSKQMAAG